MSTHRLIETNKLHRVQEARKDWEANHANSPFRIKYSSDFSFSSD